MEYILTNIISVKAFRDTLSTNQQPAITASTLFPHLHQDRFIHSYTIQSYDEVQFV